MEQIEQPTAEVIATPAPTVESPKVDVIQPKDGKTVVERRPDGTILPGVKLNPSGMKKGTKHLTTMLRQALENIEDGESDPLDVAIIKNVAKKARRGDEWAISHIWNRIDGVAPQTIVHEGDGLGAMTDEQKKKLNSLLGVVEPAATIISDEEIAVPEVPEKVLEETLSVNNSAPEATVQTA